MTLHLCNVLRVTLCSSVLIMLAFQASIISRARVKSLLYVGNTGQHNHQELHECTQQSYNLVLMVDSYRCYEISSKIRQNQVSIIQISTETFPLFSKKRKISEIYRGSAYHFFNRPYFIYQRCVHFH